MLTCGWLGSVSLGLGTLDAATVWVIADSGGCNLCMALG